MEALDVVVRYSDVKIDMAAEGSIGSRAFQLESDGSFLRSKVRVTGVCGPDSFMLEGRTKNFVNRNFSVTGQWAGSPLELKCRVRGSRYLIEGTVDSESIRIEVQRWLGGELKTVESDTSKICLSFSDTFDPVLEGTVERFIDGAVFAAFLPCLLRNQHGSIDPFSGAKAGS